MPPENSFLTFDTSIVCHYELLTLLQTHSKSPKAENSMETSETLYDCTGSCMRSGPITIVVPCVRRALVCVQRAGHNQTLHIAGDFHDPEGPARCECQRFNLALLAILLYVRCEVIILLRIPGWTGAGEHHRAGRCRTASQGDFGNGTQRAFWQVSIVEVREFEHDAHQEFQCLLLRESRSLVHRSALLSWWIKLNYLSFPAAD